MVLAESSIEERLEVIVIRGLHSVAAHGRVGGVNTRQADGQKSKSVFCAESIVIFLCESLCHAVVLIIGLDVHNPGIDGSSGLCSDNLFSFSICLNLELLVLLGGGASHVPKSTECKGDASSTNCGFLDLSVV